MHKKEQEWKPHNEPRHQYNEVWWCLFCIIGKQKHKLSRYRHRNDIKCPIGENVTAKRVCPKCAYAIDCKQYGDYLTKQNRAGKLRAFYWKIRAKISAWFNYIYANVMGEY